MFSEISDTQSQLEYMAKTFHVICGVCKQELGDYKPYFAQEHLSKHPEHKRYEILKKPTH